MSSHIVHLVQLFTYKYKVLVRVKIKNMLTQFSLPPEFNVGKMIAGTGLGALKSVLVLNAYKM